MRVFRGGKSGMQRTRRSEGRTRSRTRRVPASREGGRLDVPTRRQGKTRCTGPVGTTRTRSATWAPLPVTGVRHPEKRRARWSLLRGPLRPDEAGIIYTMSRRGRSILSRGRSPPPEGGVDGLENVFTARVRSHRSNRGGGEPDGATHHGRLVAHHRRGPHYRRGRLLPVALHRCAAPRRRIDPHPRGRRSGHETPVPPVSGVRTEPAIRAVFSNAARGWAAETTGRRACLPDFDANPILRELRIRPHCRCGLLHPMRRSGPTITDTGPRCPYGDTSIL